MSYLNRYNVPDHWRKLIPKVSNRNSRVYVKTMNPGKPQALSIPVWIIGKRMMGPTATAKKVKALCQGMQVNGKPVTDDRVGVMAGDTLEVGGIPYLFYLKKQGTVLSYELLQENPEQKLIVGQSQQKGVRSIVLVNGARKPHPLVPLVPGSIWTPQGIRDPTAITSIVRLTGRQKFRKCKVVSVKIEGESTSFTTQTGENFHLTWEDLGRRRYLLLL